MNCPPVPPRLRAQIAALSLLALAGCADGVTFADIVRTDAVDTATARDVRPLSDGAEQCVPGTERPCYDGAAMTQNVGPCRAGTQRCMGVGELGTWNACAGQTLPMRETCGDGMDNDCNGRVDDTCAIDGGADTVDARGAEVPPDATADAADVADVPGMDMVEIADVPPPTDVVRFDAPPADAGVTIMTGPVGDYDVAGDTRVFVASVSGSNINGRCFAPDGTPRGAMFTIATTGVDAGDGPVQVNTARRTGLTLVSWVALDIPGDFSSRNLYSRLYDGDCNPITPMFAWPPGRSGNYVFDAAIDQDGNFVLFWQNPGSRESFLSFYDTTGTRRGTSLLVDTTRCQGNYAFHVALNALTGAGVVTCQEHASNPVVYRRFDAARAWIEPTMVVIPETMGGHSSWYESHIVGMNDVSEFAVEWEDYSTPRTFRANFYSSSGAFVRNVVLGPVTGMGYDAFRQRHQAVQIFAGRDFVFRDDASPVTIWRYSPAGDMLLGCGRSALRTDSWRTGGTNVLFLASASTVVRAALDLSAVACP